MSLFPKDPDLADHIPGQNNDDDEPDEANDDKLATQNIEEAATDTIPHKLQAKQATEKTEQAQAESDELERQRLSPEYTDETFVLPNYKPRILIFSKPMRPPGVKWNVAPQSFAVAVMSPLAAMVVPVSSIVEADDKEVLNRLKDWVEEALISQRPVK